MKVGFFDSGLGGLTVLKEAIENYGLKEEVYYLGDTKNTPYGVKDEEVVKDLIDDNISYLVDEGCNPIVIACNTATALSIRDLRAKYPDIYFIGTEPAVKVAADNSMHKKILVLATSITVKKEKLLNLVEELNVKDSVVLEPADKLVTFAEDENCKYMGNEVEEYLEDLLSKYDMNEFSHIVLGCTHFPLFKDNFKYVISKNWPFAEVEIIDGAKGISNNLNRYIEKLKIEHNIESNNSKCEVNLVITSENEIFVKRAKEILNNDCLSVQYKLQRNYNKISKICSKKNYNVI